MLGALLPAHLPELICANRRKIMAKRKVRKVRANQRGARSAGKPAKGRKITTLDAAALLASVKHHPGPGNARTFAASRLPQSFQTVIDPNKNPPQPFQPLPPPTGKAPFHLSLGTVLSAQAIATIATSGQMVVHAV